MFPVRAGILLGLFCLVLNLFTRAQISDSIPVVSHQDGLSRTSVIMNFGGPAVSGMGFEYSYFRTPRFSLDIRTVGLIIPDKFVPGYVLYAGPQLQLGAKTSRFILGLGYASSARYGRNVYGSTLENHSGFFDYHHGVALTLGYRVQHKHGFFLELDAHVIANNQMGFGASPDGGWGVYPWGGLIFGYRLPSKAMRDKWKAETAKIRPIHLRSKRLNREERKELRQLRLENEELADWLPENRALTEHQESMIGKSSLYLEFLGTAMITLNHDLEFALFRSKIPRIKLRTGVGATLDRFSAPIGIGIGGSKNRLTGFLEVGTILHHIGFRYASFYLGASSRFRLGYRFYLGANLYVHYSPNEPKTRINTALSPTRGSVSAGLIMGYRLGMFHKRSKANR